MSERPWLERYDEGVPKTIDYPEIPLVTANNISDYIDE